MYLVTDIHTLSYGHMGIVMSMPVMLMDAVMIAHQVTTTMLAIPMTILIQTIIPQIAPMTALNGAKLLGGTLYLMQAMHPLVRRSLIIVRNMLAPCCLLRELLLRCLCSLRLPVACM